MAKERDASGHEDSDRALTRGFLFADLRGYTDFVDRHGDHAAAKLLTRYREVVRQSIAAFDGAEIKTEGDSFYVVFPSASSAVRGALEIIASAARATAEARALPISVGIGVHAGEAVETAEGYVGAAVNIAARVCSQAQPGQILVTDTVRSLTRTFLDVPFSPVGNRRLKGIAEPVPLYSVADGRPRRRARVGRTAAAAVLGGGLALAGALGLLLVGPPAPTRPTLSSPQVRALRSGALEPGMYRTVEFHPTARFQLGASWVMGNAEAADAFAIYQLPAEAVSDGYLYLLSATTVVARGDGCDLIDRPIDGRFQTLVDWLQTHPDLEVRKLKSAAAGGSTGNEFTVRARRANCDMALVLSRPTGDWLQVETGVDTRLLVIDVAGRGVVIYVTGAGVDVLATLRFEP